MDAEITLMDAMVPAFTAMHENGGHLPTECIFAFAHQFSSDMFTGIYNVPSYTIWKSDADQTPSTTGTAACCRRCSGPDRDHRARGSEGAVAPLGAGPRVRHLPDARVVMTHRDPLRVVGSLADTMATLHWMHSDRVAHADLVEFLCMGVEIQMNGVTEMRGLREPARRTRSPTSSTRIWSPIRSAR